MRAWLLCLFIAGAAGAAEDAALKVVESCRARLDPARDIGLEKISRRCPELLPALAAAPWKSLLPPDLRERQDEISAQSLRELAALVRAASAPADTRAPPDLAALTPVLQELGEQGQQGATRWERFKRWLQDKLESDDKRRRNEDSWLEKLGREFETSEGVARAITYVGYGVLALLVAFVIWSELRAAGLLGGAARQSRRAAAAAEWRRRLQLADILQAPLSERPGLLLKLLGEALVRSQRLPAADGLTAAALVRQAQLDSEQQRSELALLARTAEAVRYAPQPPAEEQLKTAVDTARPLVERFARIKAALRAGRGGA